MRIKVVSDGTTPGSKVVNADTGDSIDGVVAIEWSLVAGGIARLALTVIGVPVDVIGEASVVSAETNTNCNGGDGNN